MRVPFLTICFMILGNAVMAQPGTEDKPKVVVGIIVDQMRQEYLYRFYPKFGEGGFKRFLHDGFVAKNGHYNYAPTVTGPGHASVYTGTTPAIHGIISNEFYYRTHKKELNCVVDDAFETVGLDTKKPGAAPTKLLSSTVTDELKLATQKRAKVVGLSMKNRGAVLPAGHMADGAYWFDGSSGKFVTSTYYTDKLPNWVEEFNNKNLAEIYLSQDWKTVLPIKEYTASGPDQSPYEMKFYDKKETTFPYQLSKLRKPGDGYWMIGAVSAGVDFLTDFGKAALVGEKLGKRGETDFLCISYSTTDNIGHEFGPNSVEIQDVYLRLDRALADLFKTLDKEIGVGEYTVFLSADHGVVDVPQYLKDQRMHAGYFSISRTRVLLEEYLEQFYPGRKLIEYMNFGNVYLNHEAFSDAPQTAAFDMMLVSELIAKFLLTQEGIANVYTESVLRQASYGEEGIRGLIMRGYHPKRAGDILYVLEPGFADWSRPQGSTHGSPYTYDTHVPILFYGKGIRKGSSHQYYSVTQIAPTISALLEIKFPSGATGQPIAEVLAK